MVLAAADDELTATEESAVLVGRAADELVNEIAVPLLALHRFTTRFWGTTTTGAADASAAGLRPAKTWRWWRLRAMCGELNAEAERARERTRKRLGQYMATERMRGSSYNFLVSSRRRRSVEN